MNEVDPKAIVQKYFGEQGVALFKKILAQPLQRADIIVFLQGDQLDRAPAVLSLFQQGFASAILISGNNVLVGPNTRPEENDFPLGLLKQYFVDHGVDETSIIVDNQSFNNLGQAANVIRIAKEKEWHILLIVVSAYHALRAYLAFVHQAKIQQWNGKIIIHAVKIPWNIVPGGRTKSTIDMLEVEMEKIQKYVKDLATIEQGLEYFQTL